MRHATSQAPGFTPMTGTRHEIQAELPPITVYRNEVG